MMIPAPMPVPNVSRIMLRYLDPVPAPIFAVDGRVGIVDVRDRQSQIKLQVLSNGKALPTRQISGANYPAASHVKSAGSCESCTDNIAGIHTSFDDKPLDTFDNSD